METTDRRAQAIARLTDNFGKAVGRSWLMNEVFPGKPAADVHAEFDILIREVTAALPALGMMLVTQSTPDGATTYALKARSRRT